MKTIIILFFSISLLTFAIPDFKTLNWGFSKKAVEGYYPKLEDTFATGDKVTKFNYFPNNSKINKITFFFYKNQLYKITKEFDTKKVKPTNVKEVYQKYYDKWGKAQSNPIDKKYDNFSFKGNELTWINKTTYISLIGRDKFDKNNAITESTLFVEYGFIDPSKRKDKNSLNRLILGN